MKSKILMTFTAAILQSCIWQSSFATNIGPQIVEPIKWSELASHQKLKGDVAIIKLDTRLDGWQKFTLADKFGMFQDVEKRAGEKYKYSSIYKGTSFDPLLFYTAFSQQEALRATVNKQLQTGQLRVNAQFDPLTRLYKITNKTNKN